MSASTTRWLAALVALPLLAGCRSAWYGARFVPAPLEAQVLAEGEPLAQARALVRVRGIRRARPGAGRGPEVEVLLRLDNLGETPLALAPEGLDLVAADLVSFDPPRIEPAPGELVEVDQQATYTLSFPLPADRTVDEVDWEGLNFKWKVRFGEREVVTGVGFDRYVAPIFWDTGYYGPFGPWYPFARPGVSVGVGVGGNFED